ncbi:hypothetical protein BDN67DRAFT_969058 [Paxillus ammoniavirescens]|nr:hypothetical protein BDN67DRAFT_969058 [Paxillus ammoniavirescens]
MGSLRTCKRSLRPWVSFVAALIVGGNFHCSTTSNLLYDGPWLTSYGLPQLEDKRNRSSTKKV